MKKILILFIALVVTAAVTSCNDFLDINEDPNNAKVSSPALTLPAAISSTASVVGANYNILGGLWVQYWTQDNGSNQYKDLDAYNIQQSTLNNQFNELYSGALRDFEFVRDESKKSGDWNFYLIATLMQCYTYQVLVDLYDQIPFDEALQGLDNITPKYRTGEEVYDSLIVRIDEAMGKDFNAETVTNPGTSDLLFNGDIEKWKQFANTLKLKIYIRQIYARETFAKAGIAALYTSGATFLDQDAAMTQFIDQENKSNPLFEVDQRKLNTANNIRGSKTFIDFLKTNEDPRLDKLFIPGSAGQEGLAQGNFGVSTVTVNPASISRALIKATDPVYFISESESYFLQSEAALYGLGSGNVEELYVKGIEASLKRLDTLTSQLNLKSTIDPEVDSIVILNTLDLLIAAGKPYAFPADNLNEKQLKAIITQKWIALAGIESLEAFFERNRTGYPKYSSVDYEDEDYVSGELVYPIGGVTGEGNFPKRLLFTRDERSRNPNTPTQEPITANVWWDINN